MSDKPWTEVSGDDGAVTWRRYSVPGLPRGFTVRDGDPVAPMLVADGVINLLARPEPDALEGIDKLDLSDATLTIRAGALGEDGTVLATIPFARLPRTP